LSAVAKQDHTDVKAGLWLQRQHTCASAQMTTVPAGVGGDSPDVDVDGSNIPYASEINKQEDAEEVMTDNLVNGQQDAEDREDESESEQEQADHGPGMEGQEELEPQCTEAGNDEPEALSSDPAMSEALAPVSAPLGRPRKRERAEGEQIQVRRPRWGDKAFDDITMKDVETIVRQVNMLEKKVEENADIVAQFQEIKGEKKSLEKALVDVGSEEVSRVKTCIGKQLLSQMQYVFAWNSELKDAGRTISAFVPNVSLQLLKELGGSEDKPKTKQVCRYFEKAPTRQVPAPTRKNEKPFGSHLILSSMTFKYIKTTSELQVSATYKFGNPEKKKPAAKSKGNKKKAKGADAADEDGQDGEDDDNGEDVADDDEDCDAPAKVVGDTENHGIALGGQ